MPKCAKCGNKVSIFDIDAWGCCPECVRAESEAQHELQARNETIEQARARIEKELVARREEIVESGELPALPCVSPKALELKGNSLVLVSKTQSEAVPLRNIASFTLKPPAHGSNGVITLKLQMGSNTFAAFGGIALGLGSEVSAVFKPQYLDIARLYEKYIIKYNSEPTVKSATVVPTIDDLRALKTLVDEGVLTEEEFAAKKKQILGI